MYSTKNHDWISQVVWLYSNQSELHTSVKMLLLNLLMLSAPIPKPNRIKKISSLKLQNPYLSILIGQKIRATNQNVLNREGMSKTNFSLTALNLKNTFWLDVVASHITNQRASFLHAYTWPKIWHCLRGRFYKKNSQLW